MTHDEITQTLQARALKQVNAMFPTTAELEALFGAGFNAGYAQGYLNGLDKALAIIKEGTPA